jgi:hypothetical protein
MRLLVLPLSPIGLVAWGVAATPSTSGPLRLNKVDTVRVSFSDGRTLEGKVLGEDPARVSARIEGKHRLTVVR